jgi:hypothetical protein
VPALGGAAAEVLADYGRGDVQMLGFVIAAITPSRSHPRCPRQESNLRLAVQEPLLSQLSYDDEDDHQRRLFQQGATTPTPPG